jgi:hypothetical protein
MVMRGFEMMKRRRGEVVEEWRSMIWESGKEVEWEGALTTGREGGREGIF